ncbi:hypothetical protein ACWD0E_32750, partial [Streptomyces sp. NPDC003002]
MLPAAVPAVVLAGPCRLRTAAPSVAVTCAGRRSAAVLVVRVDEADVAGGGAASPPMPRAGVGRWADAAPAGGPAARLRVVAAAPTVAARGGFAAPAPPGASVR